MRGPLFIAQRLFFRQRREQRHGHPLLGASLGIALSLIPLVTVDHVADGMIDGIIGRYRETSTFHFQVHSWGYHERDEWDELARLIRGTEGALSSWVERRGFGLARFEEGREGLTLRAVPSNLPQLSKKFGNFIEFDSGEWHLDSADSILLGREAAKRLNAYRGDEIRVLTARKLIDGRFVPRVTRFVVRGVFTSGYQDLDRTWAFIPLDKGWTILSPESSHTFIGGLFPTLSVGMEESKNAVISSVPPSWFVYDWKELNYSILRNLESTRSILLFIMALIVLVAVFNVTTSLIMLTIERRREIGILKCTGSSPGNITATFLLAGMLASVVGTLAGLGGGLLVSRFVNEIIGGIEFVLGLLPGLGADPKLLDEAYYLQYIPIVFRWRFTAFIGIATFLLSLLASAYPASRAGRLRPLSVLRLH